MRSLSTRPLTCVLERRCVAGLPAPDLDLRAATALRVLVLEIDRLDHPLVAREIDHARARTFLEEVLHLRIELLVVRERDLEVEELEIRVFDVERQLRELALVAPDLDAITIDVAIDLPLAELFPAFVVPAVRVRGCCEDECEEHDQDRCELHGSEARTQVDR
jgi:hypothetical protein